MQMRDDIPIDDPHGEIGYDVIPEFQYTNAYGAHIYKDPWDQCCLFKMMDNHTILHKYPNVKFQGDLYTGIDGAHYRMTIYPDIVDAYGAYQKVHTYTGHTEADALPTNVSTGSPNSTWKR